jgi:TPP-dependent pyruvate/acetoin dehydrogenase alpha subunit
MGTALSRSESQTDLALKASNYQITAWPVDGMDVEAVEAAARQAMEMIRGGGGPAFLELRTYRFRPHSMYDPELYRSKEEIESWRSRDPLASYPAALRQRGILDDETVTKIESDVVAEIAAAIAFAESATWESLDDLERFVYVDEGAA